MKFIGQQAKIKIKRWLPKWLPTVLYAVLTVCMVWIMVKQLQLNYEQFQQNIRINRPYLFIQKYEFGDEGVNVFVRNIGNIPARVEVKKLCYSRENDSYKEYCIDEYKIQSKKEMYIYPALEDKKLRVDMAGKKVLDLINSKGYFKIIIRFNYWRIGDREMKDTFTFEQSSDFIQDSDAPLGFKYNIVYIYAN